MTTTLTQTTALSFLLYLLVVACLRLPTMETPRLRPHTPTGSSQAQTTADFWLHLTHIFDSLKAPAGGLYTVSARTE